MESTTPHYYRPLLWLSMCIIASILAPISIAAQSGGQIIHVDATSNGVTGLTWSDALADLQQAISMANPGDEIRIAGGRYHPDEGGGQQAGDRGATFQIPDGVKLSGGHAGIASPFPDLRDAALHPTILDARIMSIHVSEAGEDVPFCGLFPDLPCRTIQYAMTRALETGVSIVRIQAGTYQGPLELADGLILQGGYDSRWQWSEGDDPSHRVTILGGLNSDGQMVTISADNLTTGTLLADLEVVGGAATGSVNGVARSSYAVHVVDSTLDLHRVEVIAGDGADGSTGSAGSDLSATPAAAGQDGGAAEQYFTLCDATSAGAGGLAGGGGPSGGGNGGTGGTMDSDCCGTIPNPFCDDYDATAGDGGGDGAGPPGWGVGGSGGGTCNSGGDGAPGAPGNPGSGGAGASSSGSILGHYWLPAGGVSGSSGSAGGGGGGGGGSGGCDDGTDSHGAGGGGGGSGGIPSPQSGGGGAGGGGSFGLLVLGASNVELTLGSVTRGAGGDGGSGGIPGGGQQGGSGGSGGSAAGGAGSAGDGGDGGDGGASGGGGGGAGGESWACWTDGVEVFAAGVTVQSGTVGVGGSGGSLTGIDPATSGGDGGSGQLLDGLTHIAPATVADGPHDRCLRVVTLAGTDSTLDGLIIEGSVSDQSGCALEISGEGHLIVGCIIREHITSAESPIHISGSADLIGCIIEDCLAPTGGATRVAATGSLRVENCLYLQNVSDLGGAALHVEAGGVAVMVGCTVTENINLAGGEAVVAASGSDLSLYNSILWNNSSPAGSQLQAPAAADIVTNIVEGGWAGSNLDVNPQWIDPLQGNFQLSASSAAIDEGNDLVVVDPLDLLGRARIRCSAVDLGAYEIQSCGGGSGGSFTFQRGDVNVDGAHDLSDVVAMLTVLFNGGVVPCLATMDTNDDDGVNVADAEYYLEYLFADGSVPAPPFASCGTDMTGIPLGCEENPNCP